MGRKGIPLAMQLGLKHTVLMSFVTFGSLITFAIPLRSGRQVRKEHTEVRKRIYPISQLIPTRSHPEEQGTPSLIGDVPARCVSFGKGRRNFLGGLSRIVGSAKGLVSGSFTNAGAGSEREVTPIELRGCGALACKEFHHSDNSQADS